MQSGQPRGPSRGYAHGVQTVGWTTAALTALALCGATSARAQDVVAPKVAVVVVGDADARLRAAAVRVEDAVVGGGLRVAEDVGLRGALRGEPAPTEDDGLASVRRARRALGLSEAEDAPNLARLGRMAGAALVVVVRADAHGGLEAVALQVAASQFYEGALDAEQTAPERLARVLGRRARHAAQATSAVTATGAAAAHASSAAAPHGPASSARATPAPGAATSPDAPPAERSFLAKSWPYLVAGALLAGCVTYVVIDQTSGNEPAQTPVLRFSPGP